jgi:hypothetical protein
VEDVVIPSGSALRLPAPPDDQITTMAAWNSKYAYNREHPSDLDPTVAPVVAVPQSPSYPSEHAAAAGASAAVHARKVH